MKSNRIKFYVLIGFLVTVSNVIFDLQTDEWHELIFDLLFTVVATFGLIVVTLHLRQKLFKSNWYKANISRNVPRQQIFLIVVVLLQTLFYTYIIRSIGYILFNDDIGEPIVNIVFWIIFVSIITIILFVYLLEAFMEVEQEKLNMIIALKDSENDKLLANYHSLKKQLNPHFLFNSFNSLLALIPTDTKKAEFFLEELSEVYRYNLVRNDEVLVTLEEEMKMIRSYFYLQKIRFGNSIQLDTNMDYHKNNYLIPPMTVELLVENAIKHNIITKEKPLHIKISLQHDEIIISNNYNPKTKSILTNNSLGIGLNNLKNQYKLLNSKIPSFKIEEGFYIARIPLIAPDL